MAPHPSKILKRMAFRQTPVWVSLMGLDGWKASEWSVLPSHDIVSTKKLTPPLRLTDTIYLPVRFTIRIKSLDIKSINIFKIIR